MTNTDRPLCPTHQTPLRKMGIRNGTQRWRCKFCGAIKTGGKRGGSKPIGDRPLTGYEQKKRYRASLPPERLAKLLAIEADANRERRRMKKLFGENK